MKLAIPDDHKGFVVTAPPDFAQAFSQFRSTAVQHNGGGLVERRAQASARRQAAAGRGLTRCDGMNFRTRDSRIAGMAQQARHAASGI